MDVAIDGGVLQGLRKGPHLHFVCLWGGAGGAGGGAGGAAGGAGETGEAGSGAARARTAHAAAGGAAAPAPGGARPHARGRPFPLLVRDYPKR